MEIHGQELRIGNLLQNKTDKALLVVCGVSFDNGIGQVTTTVHDRSKYPLPQGWQQEPIPLTEQWLKDFGFDLGKNKWWHKKYLAPLQEQICIISINMTYGSCSIGAEGFDSDINEIGPAYTRHLVMYVHQLQNLYFALTGEELTIKTK